MDGIGAPLTEFVLETVIRDGLGELRSDPTKLDDLFARFTRAHFNNQYGQTQIDDIKTWIANNQLKIVHSYSDLPTVVPCITIQMLQSNESEQHQNMGNEYPDVDTAITPNVVIPDVTPTAYDPVTGKLTIDSSDDLSLVCPGLIYVDASSNEFVIQSGNSNMTGNKFIHLLPNQTVDIGGDGRIENNVKVKRDDLRMVRLFEVVKLGVHARDKIILTRFLYNILLYILKSRQDSLEQRGIHLDHSDVSLFDREDQFEGENIYSRYFNMGMYTQFVWNQGEVNLIDCFDTTIKAPDPDPDSEDTVVVSPSDG